MYFIYLCILQVIFKLEVIHILNVALKENKRKKAEDGSGCHLNKHTEGNFKMMVKT